MIYLLIYGRILPCGPCNEYLLTANGHIFLTTSTSIATYLILFIYFISYCLVATHPSSIHFYQHRDIQVRIIIYNYLCFHIMQTIKSSGMFRLLIMDIYQ